jgi:hypothetical protein
MGLERRLKRRKQELKLVERQAVKSRNSVGLDTRRRTA